MSEPTANGRGNATRMVRMTFRLPADDKAQIESLVDAGVEPNESAVVRTAIQRYLCHQRTDRGGEFTECPTVELRADRLADHFDALEAALEAASQSRPVDNETVTECFDALEEAYRHLLGAHPRYRTPNREAEL